jgi:hypothetical protein
MAEIIGRKPGTPDVGFGEMLSGQARASIAGRPSQNGWLYYLGFRGGRNTGTTPTARLAVYGTSGGSTVDTLVGQTGGIATPVFMADGYSGADYGGAPTAAIKVYSAYTYALALLFTGASGAHGQDASGYTMHERSGLGSFPSPFGSTYTRPEGKISIWAEIQPNRAPNWPGIISPTNGSITSDATPTLSASFSDPDETLPGFALGSADKMSAYQFQVLNTARSVVYSDSGKAPASGAQQNARSAAWDVPSALGAGTYIARATFWDQFDQPSPTQEWTFTINAGGSVANVAITPADTVAPGVTNDTDPQISGSWTHSGGLSMDRFQVGLINPAGTWLQGPSGEQTLSLAPGGVITTSLGAVGGSALSPGSQYQLGIRGRDTTGLWSGWAWTSVFAVNSAPGAPSDLQPAHGTVTQIPPIVSAVLPDATNDTAVLTSEFAVRISGDTGSGVLVPSARRSFASGRHSAQLTTTELTSKAIWEWRVRATDPWGLVGSWSAWTQFTYADPPTVTITAPTASQVLTAGTPTVTFTSSAAMSFSRLEIRDNADGSLVYDSGSVATTGTSGSRATPAAVLRNGHAYTATVTVTSTLGLTGSATRVFSVAYTAPAALGGVAVSVYRGPLELEEDPSEWSRLLVSWTGATVAQVPDSEFMGYIVRRIDIASGISQIVAYYASRSSTVFIDKTPLSGRGYRYEVVYLALRNTVDQVESVPVSDSGSVTLKHAVVASMDTSDIGYPIRYWTDRGVDHIRDQEIIPTFGALPVAFMGPAAGRILQVAALVMDDLEHTAAETVEAAIDASRPILGDDGRYSPRVVFWRDPRGRGILGIQSAPREVDQHQRSRSAFEMTITEIDGSIEVEI